MPRYIDADALLESIPQKYVGFRYAVTNAPTADVVERKRGKWYDVGSLSCRCSECGCKSQKESSFCPHCGAEMRKETDDV